MANRLFQGVIHQMKDAIDRSFGVIDENYIVIASSDLSRIGETVLDEMPISDSFVSGGITYKVISSNQGAKYMVYVEGEDALAARYANVLAVAFSNIKFYYDEKYDRSNFIKNIILDNILPGDIYIKARELYFNSDVSRTVIIIRALEVSDVSIYDIVQNLFPDKSKDFIISINENDIALVKETAQGIDPKTIEKMASTIADTITGEFYAQVVIGIGTTVNNLKDLARSFKEAQAALEVGKVFDTEKSIVSYDNLGIARLIYQLPTTLCESFLREVFKRGSIENLDQETLFTIQRFFENNLNVSETSRKLFVHRNTLVYRLEKIKKITGLDLREFDHAIIFKIALMVNKYLKSNPIKY
ncbi:MAG: helix-turn-helix domain-containing protein [Clostridia bacterium]|nr:helix-turn-helix domain-containing protein [Clostridia bacterium]MBR6564676.1 helix-turn-helix domain-containing protein [Clostridia bacterium]